MVYTYIKTCFYYLPTCNLTKKKNDNWVNHHGQLRNQNPREKMFPNHLPFFFDGVLVGGGSMCPKLVKLVFWFLTQTKQLHIYVSNWLDWKFPCEVLWPILACIWQMGMSGIYHSNVGKLPSFHLILIIQFFKYLNK